MKVQKMAIALKNQVFNLFQNFSDKVTDRFSQKTSLGSGAIDAVK